ncbi:MAG: sulfite exporter TauE/SafE family protein [Roseovarius sp.]|nr:sulfite exporter TauE/SafE family protein [Roseovarius sp.]
MPETLNNALALQGLGLLLATFGVAGLVRGFTGFGTALIAVPIANIYMPAKDVIAIVALTGIASNAIILPRALRQSDLPEVGLLVLFTFATVPIGLWLLDYIDGITVRWMITFVAGGMLCALVSGWRYSGTVKAMGLLTVGAAAGLVGGITGLSGPVVILFYLAGKSAVRTVRANTIVFLASFDFVVIAYLLAVGDLTGLLILLACMMAIPYGIMTLVGQILFDERCERIYRFASYFIIALAVISGLPLWESG